MRTGVVLLVAMAVEVTAWTTPSTSRHGDFDRNQVWLSMSLGEPNIDSISMEALQLEQFKRRKESLERRVLYQQWRRPPNPLLDPQDVVVGLLEELRQPSTSGRYSGILALLETSTDAWRSVLRQSVAAPDTATNEQIAPSLEAALSRPNNQFAILLGVEDQDFHITFPTDPLDYGDTCWVECRLRSAKNDELLVATGWSLERRAVDGAWLVSTLDWQDFRDAYRPGIGREEWERICG